MSRAREVKVRTTIEVDVEVTCLVSAGEPDYFDSAIGGPGGWSPGSGPEVEIVGLRSEGGCGLAGLIDELTEADRVAIALDAEEFATDAEEAQAEDAAEARAEMRADMRREGV